MNVIVDDNIAAIDPAVALTAVSDDRRTKALRYLREDDRRGCVAAYLLLRAAWHAEVGEEPLPPVVYDSRGKPALDGHNDIYISLSHTTGAAAAVVGCEPVGVDIERITLPERDVIDHVMNEREQAGIYNDADPAIAFTRLWTMKESLLKLTGEGLRNDMRTVLADDDIYHFDIKQMSHHICTVCYRRETSVKDPSRCLWSTHYQFRDRNRS